MFAALSSCSDSGRVYRIGVSQCSQDDWRSKMNDEIEREIMFHDDAVVEIRSADDDNLRQAADIRYFADHGFDIIIVSPNEAAALTPVIKEVYGRGIPVIIFDRNIIGDSYTARIGVDDEGIGRSAAHYALHLLGRGAKAIEVYGLPGSTPADARHKGFAGEFASGGGELLATVIGNWNKDEAVAAVDSVLRLYGDVDLIYAHNDRMAIGASEVAARMGRDIRIIGIDAAPEIGIRAVADSVIDATFLYPTEGHRLIRTALAILKGEPYERETIQPASSAVDLSNADVLLLQNETLNEETGKMKVLKGQIDEYWDKHSSQTSLFYASIVIIVLLFGVVFLILRAYWQHRRHQEVLMRQNRELEEQRDTQQQLNRRLQQAIHSKLVFFTNVSHDLRTPLTLIAEPVAQLDGAPNLTPQQQTLMKIADRNVRILRRLINQILDFRKYENDKLTLSLTELDLDEAVGGWTEAFGQLARKRHMKLSLRRLTDSPVSMAADAGKLERIFFNLLSNAFKYTPDGGRITVTYGPDGDGSVVISVADTGEGISERDLGHIFDRFYQVDRVHPDGSGIGLSLSKAFAELHGGTISVRSEVGKGSVFTVTLPLTHVDGASEAPVPQMSAADVEAELGTVDTDADTVTVADPGKPVVLVIDDNRDIRQLLTALLSPTYSVLTAASGSEGIAKAVRCVPDLIICDVMMPGMDGLECCRRLKAEVTTSHIPVLMLTACSMDQQRVQGYDSGADGYLSKPFSGAVLLARCRSLIEGRKRIRELWQSRDALAAPAAKDGGAAAPTDIDSGFYARFLDVFSRRMGNSDLTVDALAAELGLERTQFYRKIKALTNFSPVELIRQLRLKQGRHLVKTSEKTMSEIAYEIGFSTPAYFTRCYREAFGETPTETRSRITGC